MNVLNMTVQKEHFLFRTVWIHCDGS